MSKSCSNVLQVIRDLIMVDRTLGAMTQTLSISPTLIESVKECNITHFTCMAGQTILILRVVG